MPNEIIHDVNSYLGSWGPQPSDHYATPRAVAAADLLTAQDWYELAVRWATEAMIEIRAGHPVCSRRRSVLPQVPAGGRATRCRVSTRRDRGL
jgi:hypothetical protein